MVPCIDLTLGPFGNTPLYISNQGQVLGLSALRGDKTFHAFLWTKAAGMQDLQTLPGDVASVGLGINASGEAVGLSLDAFGSPRAFLWQNGVMTDLNTLIPGDFNQASARTVTAIMGRLLARRRHKARPIHNLCQASTTPPPPPNCLRTSPFRSCLSEA